MILDERALKALVTALNDKFIPNEVRTGAAEGLGYVGGHAARQELIAILEDRFAPAEVRAAAAAALGRASRD